MVPEKRKICPKCHKVVFKGHDDSENCDCGEESYMEILSEPSTKSDESKEKEDNP